jgi:hypothetical protein
LSVGGMSQITASTYIFFLLMSSDMTLLHILFRLTSNPLIN